METKCLASILSFIRSRGCSDHQYCKQIHSTDTDIYAVWKCNILQHCRVYCTMKQKLLNGIVLMFLLRLGQIDRGCHRVVWVQVKCGFGLELWANQACMCHWNPAKNWLFQGQQKEQHNRGTWMTQKRQSFIQSDKWKKEWLGWSKFFEEFNNLVFKLSTLALHLKCSVYLCVGVLIWSWIIIFLSWFIPLSCVCIYRYILELNDSG